MQCLNPSIRILFVNDDPDDFLLFHLMMQEAGFNNVTSFVPEADPREVAEHLERNRPDLPDAILVDIRMPLVDGVEILREVRMHSEYDQVAVILISGSGHHRDTIKEQHPDLKIDGFLSKPIDIHQLTDVLKPFSHCIQQECKSDSHQEVHGNCAIPEE